MNDETVINSPDTPRRRKRGMRKRSALAMHSLHFGPNMTPMVDVVMVILIFFMASAAFLGAEWFLKAAIPFQSGRGSNPNLTNDPLALPPQRVEVVLDVDVAGITIVSFLKFNRISVDEFEQQIAGLPAGEATRSLEVILRPTARVPYRDVVRAHAACDAAGIFKVGYGITRPASGQ